MIQLIKDRIWILIPKPMIFLLSHNSPRQSGRRCQLNMHSRQSYNIRSKRVAMQQKQGHHLISAYWKSGATNWSAKVTDADIFWNLVEVISMRKRHHSTERDCPPQKPSWRYNSFQVLVVMLKSLYSQQKLRFSYLNWLLTLKGIFAFLPPYKNNASLNWQPRSKYPLFLICGMQ